MQKPLWRRALDVGASVLLPEVCAGCGIAGAWICSECWALVTSIDQNASCQTCGYPIASSRPTCRRCDTWPSLPIQVRSKFVFSGPLRSSILRMKYHDEFARAGWHASHLEDLLSVANWQHSDLVVPVPLHPRKLRKRGYNQAEKLAAGFAQLAAIETHSIVQRTRDTGSQTSYGRAERWANVSGAFVCVDTVHGRDILLVDDVLTTGATIHGCARALVDAGASRVRAITLATEI